MRRWGLIAAFVIWAWSALALAQGTGDVVRLGDGSFYRGTIVESTSDHVSLLLPGGETRTFARTDVVSAGPELLPEQRDHGGLDRQSPVPDVPTTHLHARADADDLSLQRMTGSTPIAIPTSRGVMYGMQDDFAVLCNLPCDVDLPAGAYQLGVAHGEGRAQRSGRPITFPAGELQLDLHYDNREGHRIAGWITWITGAVAGAALLVTAIFDGPSECSYATGYCHSTINVPQMIAGGAIFAVGMAVGLPLALWNDGVEITVRPGL
jgi:hypothetical protein